MAYILPVIGTGPNKTVTVAEHEAAINDALQQIKAAAVAAASDPAQAQVVADEIEVLVGVAQEATVAAGVARDAAEDAVQYTYLRDDADDIDDITGMVEGETAFARDTQHRWVYSGSAWVDEGPGPTATKAERVVVETHLADAKNPHRSTAAQIGLPAPSSFTGRADGDRWRWGVIDDSGKILLAADDWGDMAIGPVELQYSETNNLRLISGWVDADGRVLFGVDREGGQWQGGAYVGPDDDNNLRLIAAWVDQAGSLLSGVDREGGHWLGATYVGQGTNNSLNAGWSVSDGAGGAALWVDQAGRARAALEDSIVYVSAGDVFEVAGVRVTQLTNRGDVTHAENIGDGRFKFVATRGGEPILLEAHKAAPNQTRVHYECKRGTEVATITGQSLALGAPTPVTTVPPYPDDAFGFVNGVVGSDTAIIGPAVVPLREGTMETIGSGMAAAVLSSGLDRKLLVAGQARNGASYSIVRKGGSSGVYERILPQMRLAAAQPGGAHMRAVMVVHGETDGNLSNASYAANLTQWLADFDADAAQIFGQRDGLVMLLCQTNAVAGYCDTEAERDAFISPFQQVLASEINPRIFCIGPKYQWTYRDHAHLNAEGTREHGAMFGKVYRRVVDEGVDWKPVSPATFTVVGSDVIIDFHVPVAPLVMDTSVVTDPGNYGFNLLDAGGATITGVALTGTAQVTVSLSAAPATGWRLSYAHHNGTYTTSGATTGARGCIRDSDPFPSPFTGLALRNYCVAFQHTF